ncbi:succinate dehydrogenase/fumarate reductase iron-sulfur subunit [Mucilaginibacter achroorhodeus]|uniref:Succinate dehydrogenase/fumarate reductase iron-sulfur subunit n=1 Tax=Mucilaginibacter achroorhodeus TaxID=2599294 RepID=A0A563UBB2_9SPHI|nr:MULTISPECIES: succinate dehydrogenase/fumarate reductase iron-sulfur subunit [Mucilaginibacter]QXV66220.1 succinate dehydrogenase/fumarate reductase iron-sulfur subunit [Mucilaginibacter sp. 21P]TWR28662.1 succinate dehydrogenase/fumarate reductase iron-sulfur subunit [Mucilaginibacter achroorhodeus]
MSHENMNLTLKVWRQKNTQTSGKFVTYKAEGISPDMSFLEMLDVVNESLIKKQEDPIHFDHDCREGICGSCSLYINGRPHGPKRAITTCQLHMRSFNDGETVTIEPWRSTAFPVIKDLATDRSAFDRIQQAGGFISVNTGGVPDANSTPIPKVVADEAFNSATCIGCGACVAACKNASAMLFTSAKITQLGLLPQGQPERWSRVQAMVRQMDEEGFGNCTNTGACEAECPKEITLMNISRMNNDFFSAKLFREEHTHDHSGNG